MSGPVERLRQAGCVFAEQEAALISARFTSTADRSAAVEKRCAGTPLELVLGRVEFAGTTVVVRPQVFLPRHRAENLVEAVDAVGRTLTNRRPADQPVTVLDLGCGTGAIAAALGARHPEWSIHASDVDLAAVECARLNALEFGFAVHRSDWFDGLPTQLRGQLDMVVAHLPYVPTDQIPLLPRDYRAAEPTASIDGGTDGLDPWRAVVASCSGWLRTNGHVLTQLTSAQQAAAAEIADTVGLVATSIEYADSVVVSARVMTCEPQRGAGPLLVTQRRGSASPAQ